MKTNFQQLIHVFRELNYILDIKQKKRAFIVLFIIIISSCFELLGVTAILPFVQAILNPDLLLENELIQRIVSLLHIDGDNGLLILMGIGLIVLYLIKNSFMIFSQFVQSDYATRIRKELSVKMLRSYMSRPYTFFLNTNSSEVLRGCGNDISSVYNILSFLITILTEFLTVTMIGIFIIWTDPFTAVGVLLLLSGVLIGIVVAFKPQIKKAGKENVLASTRTAKAIYQSISGIKEIFVMQRKELFIKEFEEANEQSRKAQRTYDTLNSAPDRLTEGICVSGIIGLVCIRLMMSNVDMVEFIPKLSAFAMAAFKVFPSVGKLASRMNGIVYSMPGLENVYCNMQEAEIYEQSQRSYGLKNDIAEEKDIGELEFKNRLTISHVFWEYEKTQSPVLTDVCIEIYKGQSIALIGASGAGKTTLADVILGLLRPQKGTIKMDGVDVYTMPGMWANIVGYVPQTVFLIDDTVKNNIAFGLPVQNINDKDIWDALERAQLAEFIRKQPDGLDTVVGERGVKFSGGQRQRIAIARALYNKPEILLLDEATAALDNETETAVMESIDALQGQITMIIVAHRLTTIKNCDKIYEIKDGIAIERIKNDVLREV